MRYRLILQKNILSIIFQHYSRFFINFLHIFSLKLILTFFKNLYMRFSQKSENVTWPTVTLSSSFDLGHHAFLAKISKNFIVLIFLMYEKCL